MELRRCFDAWGRGGRRRALFVVAAAVSLSTASRAASAEPAAASAPEPEGAEVSELELFNLEEAMEVTVTSASLAEERIETSPSVVSVITEAQLRALGLRRLGEALQVLAGVSVLPTQLNDSQVAVRGVSSPASLLVTLDGVRLNSFYDGNFPVDLSLENVERIEVIRGPGSALYGTNAFSGVIAVFSKRTAQPLTLGLGGEGYLGDGLGAGVVPSLRWSGETRGWRLGLSGVWDDSRGPKARVERDNSLGRPYSTLPATTRAPRRASDATAFAERSDLLTEGDRLSIASGFLLRDRGPYFGPSQTFSPDSRFQNTQALGALDYELPLPAGLRLATRAQLTWQHSDTLLQDQPAGYTVEATGNLTVDPGELYPEGKFRQYRHDTWRAGLSAQLSHEQQWKGLVRQNRAVLGLELEGNWLPSFEYGQNYRGDLYQGADLENWDQLPVEQYGRDRVLLAAFLQDQLTLADAVWITLGARWDRYSDFGSALSPRAALVWKPLRNLTTKLLYGRAFRAPLFRELYDHTGQAFTKAGLPVLGNDTLAPETTETAEAAVEFAPVSFANLRATAFHIRTDDLVDLDTTYSVAGSELLNYPGRRIWGAEGELQLFLDKDNYLLANASFFESEQLGEGLPGWERENDRRFLDREMRDVPRLRANVALVSKPLATRVEGPLGQLRLGAGYGFVGASESNARTRFEALFRFERPAWHEARLSLGLPLWAERLELNASASRAFGQSIPISLSSSWYELPAAQTLIYLGLRARM